MPQKNNIKKRGNMMDKKKTPRKEERIFFDDDYSYTLAPKATFSCHQFLLILLLAILLFREVFQKQ